MSVSLAPNRLKSNFCPRIFLSVTFLYIVLLSKILFPNLACVTIVSRCISSLPYPDVHIYQDMAQALEVIKEHKRARVKTFKNRSDAEVYARTGEQLFPPPPPPSNSFTAPPAIVVTQEKSSNFKALKSQELVGFRKLVEKGDLESVRKAIWENPRYLVSSGDTPAIVQVIIALSIQWILYINFYMKYHLCWVTLFRRGIGTIHYMWLQKLVRRRCASSY